MLIGWDTALFRIFAENLVNLELDYQEVLRSRKFVVLIEEGGLWPFMYKASGNRIT
jgi:hypothetical protein